MAYNAYSVVDSVSAASFTAEVDPYFERGYFAITFFNSSGDVVTPTAGTATITATDDNYNYGSVVNGVVDVTNSAYDRPRIGQSINGFKVTLSGVTGADSFSCIYRAFN